MVLPAQVLANAEASVSEKPPIVLQPALPNFKGAQIFQSLRPGAESRKHLPYLRPEGEKINYWGLLGKFMGQDLTKVSLPVILSEPLTLLQRCAQTTICEERYIQEAART